MNAMLKHFILWSLVGFTLSSFSQEITDAYESNNFGLMKPGFSKQSLHFGDAMEKALVLLGKPDSVSNFYFEMDDDTAQVYHYGQNRIYFLDSKLESYHLNDAGIVVGQFKGLNFKIGDRFETGENPNFKGFPVRYEAGTFSEMGRPVIHYEAVGIINLKYGNMPVDSWIVLLFNAKHELVDIHLGDPS